MINSPELSRLRTTDLHAFSLDQLLESLDSLLREVDPLTFASLNPGATDEALKRLEIEAHCSDGLHPDLITLYRWHNGQSNDAYRYISTEAGYQKFATIEESIKIFEIYRGPDNIFENWVPFTVTYVQENMYYGLGIFCHGKSAGQLNDHDAREKQTKFRDLKNWIISIINYTMDRSTLPVPGQYWVMGVGAPSAEINRNDVSIAGSGYSLTSDGIEIEMLRIYWNIRSKEQLLETISNLLLLEDYPQDPSEGSLAWDRCRASTLAAIGYQIGWLSKDNSWKLQLQCAEEVQAYYHSWKEMANDFYYSRTKQMGDTDKFLSEQGLDRLVAFPYSPYHLPWDTDLDTTPPPDAPIDEFTLTPEDNEFLNELISNTHPRPVAIQLLPGVYTIYKTITRGVRLSGAKEGGTMIMGKPGQDALTIRYCGVILEDLTIIAQEDPERPSEDLTGLYSYEKCYIRLYRVNVESAQIGIAAHGPGQIDIQDSTINAQGRHGLEISYGNAHVHTSTITGNSQAILLLKKEGVASFTDTTLIGAEIGVEINAGRANFTKCTVSGNSIGAVQLIQGGKINAHFCTFFSETSTAIFTTAMQEEVYFQNQNSFVECSLSTNNPEFNALYIEPGYFFWLKDCKIHNKSYCKGGELNLEHCTIEQTVYVSDQGAVYIIDSTVSSNSGQYSLDAFGGGFVRAAGCKLETGVSVSGKSKVYLHDCFCKGTENRYAASAKKQALLLLSSSHLENPSKVRVVGVQSNAKAILVACTLTSNNECTFYINGGQARIWRSSIFNRHSQGVAFYNEGEGALVMYDSEVSAELVGVKCVQAEAHLYRSTIKGSVAAVFLEGLSDLLVSETKLAGDYALSSVLDIVVHVYNEQFEGDTNIKQKKILPPKHKDWEGFSDITSNSVTVNFTEASLEVLRLFDKNEENHWKWWHLVRAAFQFASPAIECTFDLQDEYYTIELRNWESTTFPDGLLQTIHELLTDAEEVEQAIHMIHGLDWVQLRYAEIQMD